MVSCDQSCDFFDLYFTAVFNEVTGKRLDVLTWIRDSAVVMTQDDFCELVWE